MSMLNFILKAPYHNGYPILLSIPQTTSPCKIIPYLYMLLYWQVTSLVFSPLTSIPRSHYRKGLENLFYLPNWSNLK